jgi:putative ABC transport system substrate-binding protein
MTGSWRTWRDRAERDGKHVPRPAVDGQTLWPPNQAVLGVVRVAALGHPTAYGERRTARIVTETQDAANVLGVRLQLAPVSGPGDFDCAFAAMTAAHAAALIVLYSPMLFVNSSRIAEPAAESRLPAAAVAKEFAEDAGLMSYGANINDLGRRAAGNVAKILRGETIE